MLSNAPTKRTNLSKAPRPAHRGAVGEVAGPGGWVVKAQPSSKPFGEALRLLMDAQGLTYRALADATRKLDGRGLTHAHINMLANGHDRPSMRAMELVAQVCGVPPAYFAEYRLAAAMRELDPMEVGLEQALANLNARLGARRRSGAKAPVPAAARARPHPTG
jgi:transcriptional regulator with XRE-family HTH domain